MDTVPAPVQEESRFSITGMTRYLWLLWVIWLTFLFYPLEALFRAHPAPARVAVVLVAVAVFASIYTWNVRRNLPHVTFGQPARSPWIPIVILAAIALALTVGDRPDWIELFIFVGVSMAPSLPPAMALRGLGAVVLFTAALSLLLGEGIGPSAQNALLTLVSGFATIIVVRAVTTERELRLARQQVVRLAVSEERLRVARDLHDLLGHSLSLISLKSELAGRLVAGQPHRAAAEIRDIEQAARTALREVREAVAGLRQPGLAGELTQGQEILAAAGIECVIEGNPGSLPAPIEGALAWAVVEGITNVIRHSRARHCTLRLTRGDGTVRLEIEDDGRGAAAPNGAGSGLAGLGERVASLGGRCESVSLDHGFRLTVEVPLGATGRPERRVAEPERASRSI
jgi:two-component system sensor histidine kinase DesK